MPVQLTLDYAVGKRLAVKPSVFLSKMKAEFHDGIHFDHERFCFLSEDG
ncbi:hypothetical protein ABES08_12645 [Peribacillus simplex]